MAARQPFSCDLLTSALEMTMTTGDEFDLRRFDPSVYGYHPEAVPYEVLHSNPNFTSLVHVKDGINLFSFALYADGACWDNGRPQARASVGVFGFPGAYYNHGCVLPWDVPQTNQSAEIHSAIAALDVATKLLKNKWRNETCPENSVSRDPRHIFYVVLLVMDSNYVVKAMTEWIRKWRGNGFRNYRGFPVANMRALLTLDNLVRSLLEEHLVIVRFWHVPRVHNFGANALAANALRGHCVGNFHLRFEAEEIVTRLDRARLRD